MSIAPPDLLESLTIDGQDLGLTAPETWHGGTKVALKTWYYKDGAETLIQRGRVTPQPVRMEFKLIGPDALNNALFLDSLVKGKTDPVNITWGLSISFEAVIESVEYNIQRTGVSVSMTCMPKTNPNQQVWLLVPPDPVSPVSLLASLNTALTDLQDTVNEVASYFDNALNTLNDAIQEVQTAVDTVTDTLQTIQQIANAPAEMVGKVRDTLTSAATAIVAGVDELMAVANAPSELPSEIAASVSQISVACHATDEGFSYVAQTLVQPTTTTLAIEGQTVSDLAEAHDVTPEAIIAANPVLARQAPTPGQVIVVPHAS